MILKELQWSWTNKNTLKNISSANKSEKYFLDKELKIPLIYCDGEKVKSYWRKEGNIDDTVIETHFGKSETIEHYNAKMKILYDRSIVIENNKYIGTSAEVEFKISVIHKIVDVILFDKDNKPLIAIEILQTNKKTHEDINKFNEVKFPIYEYNIKTEKIYPLSCGSTNKGEIKRNLQEIRRLDEYISILGDGIRKEGEHLYNEDKFIEIKSIKQGINSVEQKISQTEGEIIFDRGSYPESITRIKREFEKETILRSEQIELKIREAEKKNKFLRKEIKELENSQI